MTITRDIRSAIYTLIERHAAEPFADDEERRQVLLRADEACELLSTWLDAQPDAPERWEPVGTLRITCPCGCGCALNYYADGSMAIEAPSPTDLMPITTKALAAGVGSPGAEDTRMPPRTHRHEARYDDGSGMPGVVRRRPVMRWDVRRHCWRAAGVMEVVQLR